MMVNLFLKLTLMAAILLPRIIESTFQPRTDCRSTCGNVSIPYPFGLNPGCYLNESYAIFCNQTYNPPKPFLLPNNVEVLRISLTDHILRVADPVARVCYTPNGTSIDTKSSQLLQTNFPVSGTANKFTGVGCDTVAVLRNHRGENYTTGCAALCDSVSSTINGSCAGIGCCQTAILDRRDFLLTVLGLSNHSRVLDFNPCSYAFLVETKAFQFSSLDLKDLQKRETVPVVLDWYVGKSSCSEAQMDPYTYACKADYSECKNMKQEMGYRCFCSSGFHGNPYLVDGCRDIDECKELSPCIGKCTNLLGNFSCSCPPGYEGDGRKNGSGCNEKDESERSILLYISIGVSIGLLVFVAGSSWTYWIISKRKLIQMRQKFFKQNGGLLLQQKLSSHKGSNATTIIFTAEDLRKATNNYDERQVIGQGAFGTVYKGILPDNRVVAIKKSKISNQKQNEQFINEVVIVSQINHRNVVKLLGCCLETEVPLLVYEFINNGTLFANLHNEHNPSYLSWETRLKIAAETAGALAYLHSATSTPIIHRDIKSANILLDKNFTAKVSDFGVSRLVPLDHSQLTTMIQGTFGYLDPEYFRSGQLTEKSDVYSFGVVLAELLTGEKAICFDRDEGEISLAMYFLTAMKEDRLLQILDRSLVREDRIEQLIQVAMVAEWCLKVKSEERPSMKEVAMDLEAVRTVVNRPWEDAYLERDKMEDFFSTSNVLNFKGDSASISPAESASVGYDSIRDQQLES